VPIGGVNRLGLLRTVIQQDLEPVVEVEHLRRVLDTQPVCLIRLAADGTVLAANDAALMLLGVTSGAQALGRDFTAWIQPDQRERWRAFSAGVVQGGPASIECDLAAFPGERHPMLFHGVPLVNHPDGVESLAITARSMAGQRQLEGMVVDLEAQLQRIKAELEARDETLVAAEAARRAAEANCARAVADVRQLETALEGFAARQQKLADERAAGRRREQDAGSQLDEVQARLDQALAACQEREAALRQLQAANADLAAARAAAAKERDRLVGALREHAAYMAALAGAAPRSVNGPVGAEGPVSPRADHEENGHVE